MRRGVNHRLQTGRRPKRPLRRNLTKAVSEIHDFLQDAKTCFLVSCRRKTARIIPVKGQGETVMPTLLIGAVGALIAVIFVARCALFFYRAALVHSARRKEAKWASELLDKILHTDVQKLHELREQLARMQNLEGEFGRGVIPQEIRKKQRQSIAGLFVNKHNSWLVVVSGVSVCALAVEGFIQGFTTMTTSWSTLLVISFVAVVALDNLLLRYRASRGLFGNTEFDAREIIRSSALFYETATTLTTETGHVQYLTLCRAKKV